MLKVHIEQARPGMVLARAVNNPKKPDHALLKPGYTLDNEQIKRLSQLRVYSLWIRYPSLDFLNDVLDPEIIDQQQDIYTSLKEQFTETQDLALANIEYSQYVKQTTDLFLRILNTRNKHSIFINELHGASDDIFLHGITVAYLAMLIGIRLESYLIHERPKLPAQLAYNLTQMGVGCLLHDIGKLSLPEEMRSFRLTAQDRGDSLWQKHTEAGYEMIQGGIDPSTAQVILNHHQHFDGSGFPPRKENPLLASERVPLQGKEIHIFCRIASLANRFDGFRYLPDGRKAPSIVALARLKKPGYKKWFDPVIFDAFLETVPPFTPGEQVLLNNGQIAVITELNIKHPCHPTVRPIDLSLAQNQKTKKHDYEIEEKDINLSQRADLYITQIDGFDITEYLY